MLRSSITSFIAAETIPAGARVKFASGSIVRVELADAADNEIGTAILHSGKSSYAVDTEVGVALVGHPGTRTCIATAAFAAGVIVKRDVDGKVDDGAAGSDFGIALEAAAEAGDTVEVLYLPIVPDPSNVTPSQTAIAQVVTATADGTGTGTIAADTSFAQVTSANADHIVTLPAPVVGRTPLVINVGANGFELRSSNPATIAINGGSGALAESAIAANSTILAIPVSATAWKAIFLDADADVAKVQAAAA